MLLQLTCELGYRGRVVEVGEIRVSCECFAIVPIHENFHAQNAGDVGIQGLDQGSDRQLLFEDA